MINETVELAKEASSDGNLVHQERLDRITRMAEIEDLQAPRDPPVAPLSIKVLDSLVLFDVCLFVCLL